MKERYFFTELAATLERRLQCDVGVEGLKILIGRLQDMGKINRSTLYMREKAVGEKYLTYDETIILSQYAGYDLTEE